MTCSYVGCRRPTALRFCTPACEEKQAKVVAVLAERTRLGWNPHAKLRGGGHKVRRARTL